MHTGFLSSQVRDHLPYLKAIVQYKGHLDRAYDNIYEVIIILHAMDILNINSEL